MNDGLIAKDKERQVKMIERKRTESEFEKKRKLRILYNLIPEGKSMVIIDTPETCAECPFCIYTADEKRAIGYCNTSDEDYYCKVLKIFMEYDKVEGGIDILGKPAVCPLVERGDKKGD